MIRTFSAMAIAGLVLMAVAGTSQAAPIAPLLAGAMADHAKVMQVRWHRRCRRRRRAAGIADVVVGILPLRHSK